ncbi:MAG: hypothetical protein K0Q65_2498, partial [Clostridia bacterium]|nr:hypothetical protein [Clostridia bacterium]
MNELSKRREGVNMHNDYFGSRSPELGNEENNLMQILNSAPVGMITLNGLGRICQVNNAGLTILGKQRVAVLDKSLGESFDCKGSKIEERECG